jgi:hypothetical protein
MKWPELIILKQALKYIRMKIWVKQVWFLYWRHVVMGGKIKRFLYCRRGWHKLSRYEESTTNTKGETLGVCCLYCCYCEKYFFKDDEDKAIFKRLRDKEITLMEKLYGIDCIEKRKKRKLRKITNEF